VGKLRSRVWTTKNHPTEPRRVPGLSQVDGGAAQSRIRVIDGLEQAELPSPGSVRIQFAAGGGGLGPASTAFQSLDRVHVRQPGSIRSRSQQAASRAGRLNPPFTSLLANCRVQRVEPWSYLRDLLCLIPTRQHTGCSNLLRSTGRTRALPDVQRALETNVYRALTLLEEGCPEHSRLGTSATRLVERRRKGSGLLLRFDD